MPVEFQHRVLPCGITVVAETDSAAESAGAGFFVKTGGRDEPNEIEGVSHFLEHMMFKGTEELSAEDINRGFDEIGARNNAYTSHEITCFYAHVLPEAMEKNIELLAKMMRPALRQSDFDTEKQVILEEIAMYKDDPFWVVYEETMRRHYAGHPMGHRVLGSVESITALTRDRMLGYFTDRYSADNTVVSLAGRVDFDSACDQIQSLCASWQRTKPARDNSRPPVACESFVEKSDRVNRTHLLAFADGPAMDDDRRYAAALLGQILGGPDNSRLHWALVETGIAEQAVAGSDPHDGCGAYYFYATGAPERADEIWATMQQEIAGLHDSLNEDDLARLRARFATTVTIGGERPADRMQRLGRMWAYLGEYLPLEVELDRINRVTLDDLRTTLEAFPLDKCTLGRLEPAGA